MTTIEKTIPESFRNLIHQQVKDFPPVLPLHGRRHRVLSRETEIDGRRSGIVVIGEVSNHEEAERKMNEILSNLPKKTYCMSGILHTPQIHDCTIHDADCFKERHLFCWHLNSFHLSW